MKKLGKILIIGLLAISLSGCGKIATLANGEDAVVTTNGEGLSANDLYQALKDKYGAEIIIDLIDNLILKDDYPETEEEAQYINQQIDTVKSYATQNSVTYEYMLQYYGFTDENAAKEYFALTYKRQQAVSDYLAKELSDKKIQEYYDNNIFGDMEAKHILISPETTSNMTDQEKEAKEKEAYNLAKEIIEKLNNGEDWNTLAKEYSDDESNKDNGGELGWFQTGDMVTEFETACRSLEKDTYSQEPVETSYGYHIIYKINENEKPSLDDKRKEIQDALTSEQLSADSTLEYKTLEKIRESKGVKIEDDDLKKAYDTYMKRLTTPQTSNTTTSTVTAN